MRKMPAAKYPPFRRVDLPDRTWPTRSIERAPVWCSVDLRDGNQALVEPMNLEKKTELFQLLVRLGFKEIEVGFPAAAEVEYAFLRTLIEQDLIPDDVTIQVLTQSREHLIRKTFESLRGAKRAIVHLYNSTSTVQRRVVFKMDRPEIRDLAVQGTRLIKELVSTVPETDITFEYSPESFTGTEIDFAVDVCEGVMDAWQPTRAKKIILNLPATVELATPNCYADQIEWFCRHLKNRDRAIVSLHTHNDRGTGVAAAELGMMAGGERVEGTLFGNGERTGNVDIVTLALNLFTQGVDPGLDLTDIPAIVRVSERCTNIAVHVRHPYAGDLVFTAFSGSHQDAIHKGMAAQNEEERAQWEVPYLPIDPEDIGRTYEAIIRINSQSGKGGVAYILEQEFGLNLPKAMQQEFGQVVQRITDRVATELSKDNIWAAFANEYLEIESPLALLSYDMEGGTGSVRPPQGATSSAATNGGNGNGANGRKPRSGPATVLCRASVRHGGIERAISGEGNGPIDALCNALSKDLGLRFRVVSYNEHSLGEGAESTAVAYIQIATAMGTFFFGAAIDPDIAFASVKAVFSALNRSLSVDAQEEQQPSALPAQGSVAMGK